MAIMVGVQPLADGSEFDFKKDWLRYGIAVVIAIIGFIMKDDVLNKK